MFHNTPNPMQPITKGYAAILSPLVEVPLFLRTPMDYRNTRLDPTEVALRVSKTNRGQALNALVVP